MKRPARGTKTTAPSHKPADRTMPHSLEAERAALAAALLSSTSADYVADHLCAESFFRQAHQLIFKAVQTLRHQNREVDLVTLQAQLGPKELEEVGGPRYITELPDGHARSTNVAHYAHILEDLRAKRAMVHYANGVLDGAYGNELSGRGLIEQADSKLLELQGGHMNGRQAALADTLPQLVEDLEYRSQNRGALLGLDTGYPGINELTFGLQPGDVDILAARPSIGKTTLALNMAEHIAGAGARVAIFSMEMRRKQLEYRFLSSLSQIPLTRLLTGWLGDDDWPALNRAVEELHEMKIEIDDATGRTVAEIRSACRRMKGEEAGLDLVIIDYVQLIPGTLDRRGASRNDELTDISRKLKLLADEGGFPILLLSQLNRADTKAPDKRPGLQDLRDSGALEQDADAVCFLHRKHHQESGPTEFIVGKQRNGPTGTVMLTINRDTTTFTSGGDPLPLETPEEKAATRKARQVSFFKQRARSR